MSKYAQIRQKNKHQTKKKKEKRNLDRNLGTLLLLLDCVL